MFQFEISSTDELRALAGKKVGLVQLIRVAQAIERLQKGLEAVVLMGKPSSGIPKHAIRFYEQLSDHIRSAPTDKILSDVDKLDQSIAANIDAILDIASRSTESLEERRTTSARQGEPRSLTKMLDDFRRRAQTAVSLRVLLKERGVPVPPLNLAELEQLVQVNLKRLDSQEKEYKTRIETHIVEMQSDIALILENPHYPEAIRAELKTIQQGLVADLRHLHSGKGLDQLPFSIVKLGVDESREHTEPATPLPEPQQHDTSAEKTGGMVETGFSGGFFAKIWAWLNTPPEVTWAMLGRQGKDSTKK
ncbi:MAG: hypothetical protein HY941_08580 [Gammaproteobacteria bacterium]|nr:hypothetical protein [Gammaproteobacteria bacterium]